jgi:hypothetical protein
MTDAEWRIEDIRLREEYAVQYARDLSMRAQYEMNQQARHDAAMTWAREKEAAEKARHEQAQAALNRQFDLLINPPDLPPSAQQMALEKIAEKITLMAEVVYDHLKRPPL